MHCIRASMGADACFWIRAEEGKRRPRTVEAADTMIEAIWKAIFTSYIFLFINEETDQTAVMKRMLIVHGYIQDPLHSRSA